MGRLRNSLLLRNGGIAVFIYALPFVGILFNAVGVDFSKTFSGFALAIYVATLVGASVFWYTELLEAITNIRKNKTESEEGEENFLDRFKASESSRWAALIHIILLILMLYTCFIAFFYNTSYQYKTTRGISGTTINVYGMGKAIVNNDPKNTTLWGAADIAVPAEEDVVAFVITKRVSVRQALGTCGESRRIPEARCSTDTDCVAGDIYRMGNGIATGNCVDGTCEVEAWCPIEPVEGTDGVTIEELDGVGKYLLHIRNYVNFDLGDGVGRSYNNSAKDSLCTYSSTQTEPCPIFSLESIVQEALNSTEKLSKFPENGSIISLRLQYECWFAEDNCLPKYSFTLIESNSSGLANYSFTDVKYSCDDKHSRTFIKATGLLFLVEVDATIQRSSVTQTLASSAAVFVALKGTKPLKTLVVLVICIIILIRERRLKRYTATEQSFVPMEYNE